MFENINKTRAYCFKEPSKMEMYYAEGRIKSRLQFENFKKCVPVQFLILSLLINKQITVKFRCLAQLQNILRLLREKFVCAVARQSRKVYLMYIYLS
jgi:hypothetical protein